MMGTDIVPETLVTLNQLTGLITREDFINLTAVKTSDLAVDFPRKAIPHAVSQSKNLIELLQTGSEY
jgi:hypothetical protein